LDHATVNDVAIGALAFRALKGVGCERFALLIHENSMHEALHVRGRAFLDRIQHENLPALTYASHMERGDPARIWPGELRVLANFDEIAEDIQNRITPKKKQPLGIFCAIDIEARKIHQALEQKGLLSDGSVQLIIAGTTEYHVGDLKPRPRLINLGFPELIETTLERLIYRTEHKHNHFHTFLIQPALQK
jgi:DNA-binding LacI/PurR family transcriptional regulator